VVNEKQHILVPKHSVLNEKDSENLLKKLNTTKEKLPKIDIADPGIKNLKIKNKDIIEIERNGHHGEKTKYWRVVVDKKTTFFEEDTEEKGDIIENKEGIYKGDSLEIDEEE